MQSYRTIIALIILKSFGVLPNHASAAELGTESSALLANQTNDDGFYVPADLRDDSSASRPRSVRPNSRRKRPWYKPRFALGVGGNIPELMNSEAWLSFGKYFALHGFWAPQLPFNIRVEMPADVISTKKGIGVANPDFNIHLKAHYGPHYGINAVVFPFGGSFFVAAGGSRRQMQLSGSAKSSILICSLIEVAKEPPCPDPRATLHPDTKLRVDADVMTSALILRGMAGFWWDVGDWAYISMQVGASKPKKIQRRVKVSTTLDFPGGDDADDEITGALAQVKTEREAELERKAIKEMRPVDSKVLPIMGLTAGVRF